ncbi:outer membrane lipoprotein chaperone LolA [Aliagarivorans marinus]|uniref:outer membrane lipoprotein chaperone LolA n=1 Tax=Aliagarivorans marinus TaxID=561965 RepID=UPI0004013B1B|nr:outer membrane lipoprotein chaperone LolA [Aliagarivorans marinus]
MKKIVSALVLAACSAGAVASDVTAELKQALGRFDAFSANFEQRVIDIDGNLVHQAEGELLLAKPAKLRWQQTFPEDDLIVSDGATLWYYSPFIEQVSIMDATSAVEHSPIVLLSDQRDSTWQQYAIEREGEGYLLTSKEDALQARFWVKLDGQEQVERFDIIEQNGQRSEFVLSGLNTSPDYQISDFQFVIPDGTAVDDQR